MVCHCLLVESESGLILIDTGLGTADVRSPHQRLGKGFIYGVNPLLLQEETAFEQVKKLGFKPEDVQHIIVTHLDVDHAGGLADFPQARVHIFEAEYKAALSRKSLVEKERYRAIQWAHQPHWEIYPESGESWLGFECVRELKGLPSDILLVPLVGHTRGHCGIAIDTGSHWLLHAGDAYFHHDEIHAPRRRCPLLLDAFQSMFQFNGNDRIHNQYRLRDLKQEQGEKVKILCAHDQNEFKRAAGI